MTSDGYDILSKVRNGEESTTYVDYKTSKIDNFPSRHDDVHSRNVDDWTLTGLEYQAALPVVLLQRQQQVDIVTVLSCLTNAEWFHLI
jgi:hypothetical protein